MEVNMEKETPSGDMKQIKIKWGSADDLPALYSNHLFISHGGQQEFYLVFGHLDPPIGFSDKDFPDELEIKPMAKIVISPEAMESFVRAMNENLRKYKEKKREDNE
jgi:hypothetical protein